MSVLYFALSHLDGTESVYLSYFKLMCVQCLIMLLGLLEPYVLRFGILPLMFETGISLEEEMQICSMCCLNDVENEFHFVF